MTTTSDPENTCRTCLNDKKWHEENNPIHPFNTGEANATAFLGQRDRRGSGTSQRGSQDASRRISAPRPAFPMDPVLRQALIDNGVITPKDLTDAEAKIQAITGMFNQTTMRGSDERADRQ
jgi:hypothetical protein